MKLVNVKKGESYLKTMCSKPLEKAFVKEQKKQGEKVGEIVLGEEILIHTYFFRTRYIRYEDIKKAFVRVENNQSGDLGIDEYSLVLIDKENKEHVLHVDYRQYGEEAVQYINNKLSSL